MQHAILQNRTASSIRTFPRDSAHCSRDTQRLTRVSIIRQLGESGELSIALTARHVFHTRSYLASAHHSGKPQITTRRHGHAHEQSRTETAPCTPEAAAGNIDEILAAPPETLRAVREAVQAAPRLSPVLLLAIARAESRFAPEAQNRSSSARGLLQFTRDTWLEVMRQFGAQHGFPVYAKAIRKDQTGRLSVDRPATLRAILRLRDDPRLSAVMAVERLMQLCEALERELGRKASAPDLYFLHVLGPTGAARFLAALRSQPQSSKRGGGRPERPT